MNKTNNNYFCKKNKETKAMNIIDKQLFELYQEYFPFLIQKKGVLQTCSDEYIKEGNIRLLFGYYGENKDIKDILKNAEVLDLVDTSCKYVDDIIYSRCSFENFKDKVEEFNYSYYGEVINIVNINRNLNGERRDNFAHIRLNPFRKNINNLSEQQYKEKQKEFLIKQINILKPDAIIIGSEVYNQCEGLTSKTKKQLQESFGTNIVFYPLPLPAKFLHQNESNHLSAIIGIKDLKIPIIVFSWDMYHDQDYVSTFLKIISDYILKNTKNGNVK